jgi:hypothetical protein
MNRIQQWFQLLDPWNNKRHRVFIILLATWPVWFLVLILLVVDILIGEIP